MNVLVWSSYVARPVGGQERIAHELALQLHKRGHHVVLVGAYDNVDELRRKIPPEMPYYFFDLHARKIKPHLAAARLLGRLLDEYQIEVLSAHGNIYAPFEVCRLRKIPFIWTIHGTSGRAPKGVIERLKSAAVLRVLASPLTQVAAISQANARTIQHMHPKLDPRRIHVIHNGTTDEAALADLPLPAPGPPWRLGFVGRLVPLKRALDLVALARVLDGVLD